MFTDNKNFYPTPKNLINKMVEGLNFDYIHTILEPSAGKGDIVDFLMEKEKSANGWNDKYNFDIDCIEIDKNLQAILKQKNYKIVYNDFLSFDTMKEYDLIIMNPPFDNGARHLLKAIEMQKRNGGALVCLLNAETLKNAYTNDRRLLLQELTDSNATIEYIQDAFMDAERKTGVETALIKVKFPEVENNSIIWDNLKKAKEQAEMENANSDTQLAENDFLKSIIDQYNMELKAGIKLIKEYKAMSKYIMCSFGKDEKTGKTIQTGGSMLVLDLLENRDKYRSNLSINGYVKEVRRKYWKALFTNPLFIGKLTDNLQREYYNKLEEMTGYDFTMYNICELKLDMNKHVVKGIEDTIINLFEELSNKYHYYDEMSKNIHYYNGWKTNKSYIINKKVIIPLNAYSSIWGEYEPSYTCLSKLQDMEKCFNYLDGGLTESIDLKESLKFAEEYGETKNIELKYFTVTFYKKGTCHIVFNNDELLKKFNIFGSQHKGWLPPCYGKKKYSEMNQEEKETVNNFQGEKEYNTIMGNKDYYIYNADKNLKLLETV